MLSCRIREVRAGLAENKDFSKDLQKRGSEPNVYHGGRLSQAEGRANARVLRHKALEGFREQYGGHVAGREWEKRKKRRLEVRGVKTSHEGLCRPCSTLWILLRVTQEPWQGFKQRSDRMWLYLKMLTQTAVLGTGWRKQGQKQSDLPEALAVRPQVAVAPISEGEPTWQQVRKKEEKWPKRCHRRVVPLKEKFTHSFLLSRRQNKPPYVYAECCCLHDFSEWLTASDVRMGLLW